MKERFQEGRLLNASEVGPKGRYVVLDRPPGLLGDRTLTGRGLSMFALKTDHYTVTVTFQPSPDGKAITGSLLAVTMN